MGRRSAARDLAAADMSEGVSAAAHGDAHRTAPNGPARDDERQPTDAVKTPRAEGPGTAPRRVDVVAIFGPTASGKTAVAELVADQLGTEVVSADAMQVYRELPILTNQPARPTRLVGIRSFSEEMSLGAFAALAQTEIEALVESHGVAVVAGGTGLYLRAALVDLDVPPRADAAVRKRIEQEVDRDGAAAHQRLAALDPVASDVVHPNDRQRLVRALELAEEGHSLAVGQDRLWSGPMRRPTLVVGLEVAPDVLEARIRARTRQMFERGVVEEVRAVFAGDVSRTAAKTLGLHEIAKLEREAAVERIVVRTRRYAAYQRKWMRRIPGIVLVDGEREPAVVAAEIVARAHR